MKIVLVGGTYSSTSYPAVTSTVVVCDKPPTPLDFSTPVQLNIEGFKPSKRINKVPRNPTKKVAIDFSAVPLEGVRPLTSKLSASAIGWELVWQKVPSNPTAGLDYQKRQD